MDYLPIFVELKGRLVLLVGGGEVAARKATLLLRAGALLQVVAPELCSELQQRYQAGELEWDKRECQPEYLDGIFLVIAATDNTLLIIGSLPRLISAVFWSMWLMISLIAHLFFHQ